LRQVLADRGAYVAAALIIMRSYLTAGGPQVCGALGSYPDWSRMVRSPLVWLGEPDPVESAQGAARERDADADDPGFDFDDLGGDPALPQCNSQSQPADPCADNQDALYRRHRSSP